MNKTRPLLVPKYIHQFSCIGSECVDSCCVGWRVTIDEKTYKKYKKTKDREFQNNIKRNKSNPSVSNYAEIKMQDEGRCSFLTDENLCKVQLNRGEDFLSNTCAVYPRTINKINGMVEKSLTMSCPEAARLALLNPNVMEFDQIEELTNVRGFVENEIDTINTAQLNYTMKYFWELRSFTIEILQTRTYSLNERLILLGIFYQKIHEAVKNAEMDNIHEIIVKFKKMAENGDIIAKLSDVPTKISIQMELCRGLLAYRTARGIGSERYRKCIVETLQGIQFKNEENIESIEKNYKETYEKYYKPFVNNHEYILENYLVNYVYRNLFPIKKKTVFEDFVMLILHYAMIKLHLIGMAGYHKGLTTDLVITLIQSFSKSIEHNNAFLKGAYSLLEDKGYTSIAYMAILIKN